MKNFYSTQIEINNATLAKTNNGCLGKVGKSCTKNNTYQVNFTVHGFPHLEIKLQKHFKGKFIDKILM